MIRLHTEQFIIRDLFSTDLENIHRLHSMKGTDEINSMGIPGTIQTTEKILNAWIEKQNCFPRTSYILRIEHKSDHQFIGLMSLNLGTPKFRCGDTWFKIHASPFWREYATEALTKLLIFGFHQLDLHRIESDCAIHNIESIKVLEQLGMNREGKKRKFLPLDGQWIDSYMYAILEEDFQIKTPGII